MRVRDVYGMIDRLAPFDTQLEYDNSGILVGSPDQEVSGILFALDATDTVISEAVRQGCNLIVTHHPLMFSARRRLTDEDYEGRILMRLIRENVSLIAAHTCLDQAPGGVNDALAADCLLRDVTGEGFIRVGRLSVPMKAGPLADMLSSSLHTTVRLMGSPDIIVTRLGLCSGSGGDEWRNARALGADAFLSGEIKHHLALEMVDEGMCAFECGHFATEEPGIFALADALQRELNRVEYKLGIYKSAMGAYSSPSRP